MDIAALSIGIDATPSTQGADTFERAGDRIKTSAARLEEQIKRLRASMQNLAGQALQSVGTSLTAALTVPLGLLGAAAVKSAKDMDSLTRGLTAVMKSSAGASAELKELREVAKLPGLGFKEAIQGSINLQAAGFSAELARRSLQAFGNALATVGKGKSELDGVNLALSQIASKGKISAEEINQLAERVPQIRKVIEAAFGTSNTEILQKRGLGAGEFVSKIVTELEKLPKVTGGVANTFENLMDTIDNALLPIGNAILRVLIPAIDAIVPYIERASEAFASLSPTTQTIIVAMAGIAAAIGPVLVILGTLAISLSSIAGLFGAGGILAGISFAPLVATVSIAVAAVGALFLAWQTNFGGIREVTAQTTAFIQERFGALIKWFQDNWPLIQMAAKKVLETLQPLFTFYSNNIKATWNAIWPTLTETVKTWGTFVGGTIKAVLLIITGDFARAQITLQNTSKAIWEGVKNIFAAGVVGVITITKGLFSSLLGFLGIAKNTGEQIGRAIGSSIATGIQVFMPGIFSVIERIASYAQNRVASKITSGTSPTSTNPSLVFDRAEASAANEALQLQRKLDDLLKKPTGGGSGNRAKELSEEAKLLKEINDLERQRAAFSSARFLALSNEKEALSAQVKEAEKILELRREIVKATPALAGRGALINEIPSDPKQLTQLVKQTEALKSFFEARKKIKEVPLNENIAPSVAVLTEELKAQSEAAKAAGKSFETYSDKLLGIIDGVQQLTAVQRLQRELAADTTLNVEDRALIELILQIARQKEINDLADDYSAKIDTIVERSERLTELQRLQRDIQNDTNLGTEKRLELLDEIMRAEESTRLAQQLEDTKRRLKQFGDDAKSILHDAFYQGIVEGPRAFFQTLLSGFAQLLADLAAQILTSQFVKLLGSVFNIQGLGGSGGQSSGGGGGWLGILGKVLGFASSFAGAAVGAGTGGVTFGATGGVNPSSLGFGAGMAGFASGTDYVQRSGVYDVGELGRERVFLPQGASVMSNHQMAQSMQSAPPTVNIIVYAQDAKSFTAPQTRDQVARDYQSAIARSNRNSGHSLNG